MKRINSFLKLAVFVIFVIGGTNVSVSAAEKMLVPLGRTIGINVNLKGVSVLNTDEFETEGGKMCSPAEKAGICQGDTILSINGCEIKSAKDLQSATDESNGDELSVVLERKGEEKTVSVKPETDISDGKFRIGVWIKDSASGIGTMTYYDPDSGSFGALGHGICDTSARLIEIDGGCALDAEITSISRGEKGSPGELVGVFGDSDKIIGDVKANTNEGIFGSIDEDYNIDKTAVPTAKREEAHEGEAVVLCNVEKDEICEYSAQILKINDDETADKGMIIKISDSRLINKTGGIVQGMSGSPILQNGKLVGAVTHVCVNL